MCGGKLKGWSDHIMQQTGAYFLLTNLLYFSKYLTPPTTYKGGGATHIA